MRPRASWRHRPWPPSKTLARPVCGALARCAGTGSRSDSADDVAAFDGWLLLAFFAAADGLPAVLQRADRWPPLVTAGDVVERPVLTIRS